MKKLLKMIIIVTLLFVSAQGLLYSLNNSIVMTSLENAYSIYQTNKYSNSTLELQLRDDYSSGTQKEIDTVLSQFEGYLGSYSLLYNKLETDYYLGIAPELKPLEIQKTRIENTDTYVVNENDSIRSFFSQTYQINDAYQSVLQFDGIDSTFFNQPNQELVPIVVGGSIAYKNIEIGDKGYLVLRHRDAQGNEFVPVVLTTEVIAVKKQMPLLLNENTIRTKPSIYLINERFTIITPDVSHFLNEQSYTSPSELLLIFDDSTELNKELRSEISSALKDYGTLLNSHTTVETANILQNLMHSNNISNLLVWAIGILFMGSVIILLAFNNNRETTVKERSFETLKTLGIFLAIWVVLYILLKTQSVLDVSLLNIQHDSELLINFRIFNIVVVLAVSVLLSLINIIRVHKTEEVKQ